MSNLLPFYEVSLKGVFGTPARPPFAMCPPMDDPDLTMMEIAAAIVALRRISGRCISERRRVAEPVRRQVERAVFRLQNALDLIDGVPEEDLPARGHDTPIQATEHWDEKAQRPQHSPRAAVSPARDGIGFYSATGRADLGGRAQHASRDTSGRARLKRCS
jgi:hypothetical protein